MHGAKRRNRACYSNHLLLTTNNMSLPCRQLVGSTLLLVAAVASSRIGTCRAFIISPYAFPTTTMTLSSSPRRRGRGRGRGIFVSSSSATSFLYSTVPDNDNISSSPDSPSSPSPAAVLNKVFKTDTRPIILFDGVCNLCNNAVNLAIDWDPNATLRFAALQSNVGKSLLQYHGRDANDISSIVLVTKDGAFVKSDAILGITESLNPLPTLPRLLPFSNSTKNKDINGMTMRPLAKLASVIVPKYLRDLIYDGVADNRYSIMGKRMECRYDADGEFDDRFVDDDILLQLEEEE